MAENGPNQQDEFTRRLQQALAQLGEDGSSDAESAEAAGDAATGDTGDATGGAAAAALGAVGGAPAATGVAAATMAGREAGGGSGSSPSTEQDACVPREGRGPVGGGAHVVQAGECVSSIAVEYGHFWETVWNHEGNAAVREIRKDPNVLLAGDRLHIPPLREKWAPGQSEVRHRFRRKGQPEKLSIRVLNDDEPRGNEEYEIEIDGEKRTGVTDAEGKVECPIPPGARRALLRVGTKDVDEFVFQLGDVDPIDELSGVQGRLNNLGFNCWSRDGEWTEETESALREFQKKHGLEETGEPDGPTRKRLQREYGC